MPTTGKKPRVYMGLSEKYPNIISAVESLGNALRSGGPIGEKEALLIQLAAAAAAQSEGSVHSHTRRALAAGASAEEIEHAILLLISVIGFPKVAAAITWCNDVLEAGG
jgi:AhpD family alkylhydroperoxidase